MPELPEVEFAARSLRGWLDGAVVRHATIPKTRVVRGSSPRTLVRALEGRRFVGVDRRGKWLRLLLDDDARVFSHLGMSGRWLRRTADDPEVPSERLRLDIERRGRVSTVRYVDPRMFGRFVVAREDLPEWNALGPDPLVDGVDIARLVAVLAKTKRTIKEALMDQRVLAGIGNIQATDALFRAKIDPRARADALERRRIARARLAEGPEITYVEDANAPNPFVVYGRAPGPCPRCRTPLTRVVLGGRGTVFCPSCQHR